MESSDKREVLNRRSLMVGAAGALAAAGAAALARPAAAAAPTEAVDDEPREIANRLEAAARTLEQVNQRLVQINGVLQNPPDPDKPPIRAALLSIEAACDSIHVQAEDMLGRVGRV